MSIRSRYIFSLSFIEGNMLSLIHEIFHKFEVILEQIYLGISQSGCLPPPLDGNVTCYYRKELIPKKWPTIQIQKPVFAHCTGISAAGRQKLSLSNWKVDSYQQDCVPSVTGDE